MSGFDKENATADELWEHCLLEYKSNNPIKISLFNNYFSKFQEIIKQFDKNDKILEIGCGAGESTRRISEMLDGQYFEASEFDERYIQKLKENKFPIKVTQESVFQLKREDNAFDCVFLLQVLEHINNVELALKEIFRVSGKYVVISVPSEPIWCILNLLTGNNIKTFGNTPGHINHWSPSKFKKLISKYGIVKKVYKPLPWVIILAEVPARKIGAKGENKSSQNKMN
jgi:ubiquinone/menaquinone biosynthesis C-methylase UbiE